MGATGHDNTIGQDQSRSAMTAPLERGDTVGRFVLLSKLGEGGMGVVWAAHDAELDRKVAIKLLLPSRADHASTLGRARLVREAQALARLTHPNVVTVHDVGTVGDRVWVAMEYVEGQTLKSWLAQTTRSWREILPVMRAAGLGLAAAHEKGLVHRDFKPDNVMVGADHRVLVMDFGLARGQEREHDGSTRSEPGTNMLESELTVEGSVMGTPAYMSPEQHLGLSTDARTDQFSFCVTMWEALYGVRPFKAATLPGLTLAVASGLREPPPRDRRIPASLRRAIERGLEVDPAARHPDMNALLGALEIEARRRRWIVLGGLGATALGLAIAGRLIMSPETENPPQCTDMSAHMDEIWSPARRSAIQASLAGVEVGHAKATAVRVGELLDVYSRAWIEAKHEACAATRIRGEQSTDLMDRRMACLDERLEYFRTTLDVLERADKTVVNKADEAVHQLPRLEPCADALRLLAKNPPPDDPELARRVEELRTHLAQVAALDNTAQYDEALARAQQAMATAESLDFPPIRDQAGIGLARVLIRKGKYDDADVRVRAAYFSSLGRSDLALAGDASRRLAYLGQLTARLEEGLWWARQSEALAEAEADEVARAEALKYLGLLLSARGEYEPAIEAMTESMQLYEAQLGERHVHVASMLTNLGGVHHRRGREDEAIDHYQRALVLLEAAYGKDHPTVAVTLMNLGGALQADDQLEAARAVLERSIDSYTRMFGPHHPELAGAELNLGIVERDAGNLDRSLELYDLALANWTANLGDSHPSLAFGHHNRAIVLRQLGRLDEARVSSELAAALWETAHGREYPLLVWAYAEQAEIARVEGDLATAKAKLELALSIAEATSGPSSDDAKTMRTKLSELD